MLYARRVLIADSDAAVRQQLSGATVEVIRSCVENTRRELAGNDGDQLTS